MLSSSIYLILLPTLVIATNDWSKACTSGTCSYGSGDGKNTAWSSVAINAASTNVLSDITNAAGWEILNCDPESTGPQDIRLVCVDKSKGCDHLFNGGAEDTIVRLPENCSRGPFARVAKIWTHKDQGLPRRLAKRGQTNGGVQGIALDFDFSKIPESKGKAYITVAATTSPDQRNAIRSAAVKRSLEPIRHAHPRGQAAAVISDFTSPPVKRSPFSFGDLFKKASDEVHRGVDTIGNATKTVGKEIGKAANTVGQEVNKAANTVGTEVGKAANTVGTEVEKAANTVGKEVNKATEKLADGAKEAGKQIGQIIDKGTGAVIGVVDTVGNATKFDKNFDKDFKPIIIDSVFSVLDLPVDCSSDTSIPGGFKINADVHANVTAHVGFIMTGSVVPPHIEKLAFTGGLTGGATAIFNISVNAQGTLKSPLIKLFEVGIPGLDFPGLLSVGPTFSINALADGEFDIVADMSVGTSIDLSQMHFTFPASQKEKGSATVKPKDAPLRLIVGNSDGPGIGRISAHLIPRIDIGISVLNGAGKATIFADVDAAAELDLTVHGQTANVDPQPYFGGSVGMNLSVEVNVGAEAALLPFFSKGNNIQLFQKTFPIFEKKFGDQPPAGPKDQQALDGQAQVNPTESGQGESGQDEFDQDEFDQDEFDLTQPGQGEFDPTQPGFDLTQPGQGEVDPTQPGQGVFDPTQPGQGKFDPNQGQSEFDPNQPSHANQSSLGDVDPTQLGQADIDPAGVNPAYPPVAMLADTAPVDPTAVNPATLQLPFDNGRLYKRALVCASSARQGSLVPIVNTITTGFT